MKKTKLRIFTIVIIVLIVIGTTFIYQHVYTEPTKNLLPLPDNLISLRSQQGQDYLKMSKVKASYEVLSKNFVAQSRAAFCGVASSVIVLNALQDNDKKRFDQENFFTADTEKIRGKFMIALAGMTLEQLGKLLQCHEVDVEVVHAQDTQKEKCLKHIKKILLERRKFILVNYLRSAIGQKSLGHISPVVAYEEKSDRFLVLDVAAHKYPPVWMTSSDLWKAISTIDSASGKSRGYVVVQK